MHPKFMDPLCWFFSHLSSYTFQSHSFYGLGSFIKTHFYFISFQEETEKMRARTVEMRQLKKDLENQQLDERKEQLRLKAEEVRQAKERRRNPVKEEEPGRSSCVLRMSHVGAAAS